MKNERRIQFLTNILWGPAFGQVVNPPGFLLVVSITILLLLSAAEQGMLGAGFVACAFLFGGLAHGLWAGWTLSRWQKWGRRQGALVGFLIFGTYNGQWVAAVVILANRLELTTAISIVAMVEVLLHFLGRSLLRRKISFAGRKEDNPPTSYQTDAGSDSLIWTDVGADSPTRRRHRRQGRHWMVP